ncbi:MAG TPA: poly(ADP-ribose) glycohydrolase domain-containing protein [Candidatus Binatia bacterium]|nr:poly(ADP-ribose) glycohydrolase domain-containing protein [Candidatus Binatia bacterium]
MWTTLGASLRLVKRGLRPVALNFANGIHPGGGFRTGSPCQTCLSCLTSSLLNQIDVGVENFG